MKRVSVCLLPLAFVVSGCGGGGSNHVAPIDPLGLAALGKASMNLTIEGGGGVVKSASMVASGKDFGSVGGDSTTPDGPGWLSIGAVLRRRSKDGQSFVQQIISVQVIHDSALAVGAKFDLGTEQRTATYYESSGVPYGGDWDSMPTDDWLCTGGTVEVTSLSGASVGVRLTGVTLRLAGIDPSEPTITVSGTILGTVRVS